MTDFQGKSDRDILIEIASKQAVLMDKIDNHAKTLYDKPYGVVPRFDALEIAHQECMRKHAEEQRKKEQTAEMAIQEEKQAKLAWLDKKFAALIAVASSPWVIDAVKWFLTPKK